MNIELYENQTCNIYLTLEGEFEVYGGTTKTQFDVAKQESGEYKITIPVQVQTTCSSPRYDVFARRKSTGQEWVVLTGKITLKTRYSNTSGGISPLEYHVTTTVVEDSVEVDGGEVLIGIKGDRGYSAYEIAVQNGFSGSEEEFSNMLVAIRMYAEQAAESERKSAENASKAESERKTTESERQIAKNAVEDATEQASLAMGYASDAAEKSILTIANAEIATDASEDASKVLEQVVELSEQVSSNVTTTSKYIASAENSAKIAQKAEDRAIDAQILAETNVIRILTDGQTFLDSAYDAQILSEMNAIVALKAAQDAAELVLNTMEV